MDNAIIALIVSLVLAQGGILVLLSDVKERLRKAEGFLTIMAQKYDLNITK